MTVDLIETSQPRTINFKTVKEQASDLAQAAEQHGDWQTAELARILGDMAHVLDKRLKSIEQKIKP